MTYRGREGEEEGPPPSSVPIKHVSTVVETAVVLEYEKPWRNLELLTLGNF